MKFNERWLRELVDLTINSAKMIEQITMSGFVVNRIDPVSEPITGVIIGNIIECAKHPNSDKLYITKIDIGKKKPLNIICGAPNCRTNLRVVVATIGAILPGNIKIKAVKLRGKISEGMLCSFSDIGIYDICNSIIELPNSAILGHDIYDYLKLNDISIDIGVTYNRGDCLSILGIAREIAVLNQAELHYPVSDTIIPNINNKISISVEAPNACPRYLCRVIKNIDFRIPTPLWMKEKLRRCAIDSVNIVIDVTNFILLEMGQPMHVFDLSKINHGIVVRLAKEGESLKIFGGNKVNLHDDTLIIASDNKVISIAGIIGGDNSCINLYTKHIVLESAFFNRDAIIGRAYRYGLRTNASHRYERGVDPGLQYKAMERATKLLIDICGCQPGPIIDITNQKEMPNPTKILLRYVKLNRILGYIIDNKKVIDILIRLSFQVTEVADGLLVIVPSWRFDITIEEDLIEEVARVNGYDEIPHNSIFIKSLVPKCYKTTLSLSRVKMLLVDRGYQEVITYSFVNPKVQDILHPRKIPLSLPNPISNEMSVMRLSLWTGLLGALIYNQNRQQKRIRLFESGLCFIPDSNANLGIRQEYMLSGIMTGLKFDEHWDEECKNIDFFDAKGDIEAILNLTGQRDSFKFKSHKNSVLHIGQSASIFFKKEVIGSIGLINPKLEERLNLNGRTLVFELIWNKISERKLSKTVIISRFPSYRRDIAIIVSENICASDIINECNNVIINHIVDINLFDVYRGKEIKKGFKSLAISLIIQNINRTLEEEEITSIVKKYVEALKNRFHVLLRE